MSIRTALRTSGRISPLAICAAGVVFASATVASAGPTATNKVFEYNDFSGNLSDLNFVGTATDSAGSVFLTGNGRREAGAVWYNGQQIDVSTIVDTTFNLNVANLNGTGADGFAFVFQDESANAIGGAGGALGYADNPIRGDVGITRSVAIEFDLWDNSINGNWPDLADPHVSVHTRGLLSNSPDQTFSLGGTVIPINLSDGAAHDVRILYVPGLLQIFVDDIADTDTPVLTVAGIDLVNDLGLGDNSLFVGLTAATGGQTNAQTHQINSWSLSNFVIPSPGSLALGFGGLGLLVRRKRRA